MPGMGSVRTLVLAGLVSAAILSAADCAMGQPAATVNDGVALHRFITSRLGEGTSRWLPATPEEVRLAMPALIGWVARWMQAEVVEETPGRQIVRYHMDLGPGRFSVFVAYYDTPGDLSLRWDLGTSAGETGTTWGTYRVTRLGDGVVVSYGAGGDSAIGHAIGWLMGWRDPATQLALLSRAVETTLEAQARAATPSGRR